MGNYRELRVWKSAHKLVLSVYTITRVLPPEELYGLSGQMRRAAVSVAANLAEGSGRDSDAELRRYVRISLGSVSELEYYVLLSEQLGYIQPADTLELSSSIEATRRMLARLATALGKGKDRTPKTED